MAFCSNCGNEVPEGTRFCANCGAPIGAQNGNQTSANSDEGKTFQTGTGMPAGNAPGTYAADGKTIKKTPILGIVAIILAVIEMFVFFGKPIPAVIASVVAIVLSIISFVRKEKLKGLAIVAIIISVLSIIFAAPSIGKDREKNEEEILSIPQITSETPVEPEKEEKTEPTASASDSSATTANTEIDTETSDGVDPDLKAFLDEYEDFVDEYVDFMVKYQADPTDLKLLTEYADMLTEYAEFTDKIDDYDSDSMSVADAAYYLEVTTRCTEKMLSVAETTE